MTVQTLDEAICEPGTETAAVPDNLERSIDADDIWEAAALDWDELDSERNVSLIS
jgi:hypothetical protein